METVLQDVRVTLRAFRRSPGFPLTAIATLALGIGATTAIFTTSAVLLKPRPYPNPQDLYSLRTALTADATPAHMQVHAVTEGFFELFGLPMTSGGLAHDDFVPFTAITFLATTIPAARAPRLNPANALQSE